MHLTRTVSFSAMFLFAGMAHAQNSDATIQALLAEVKQLRMTLERSAVIAPRIQVTLQRMQLQQEQVSRLSRQLDDLRDNMAKIVSHNATVAAEIKQAELQAAQEQDATRRKALEDALRVETTHLQAERDQQSIDEASQRARESELASRLRTEQAKLDELSDKLNGLVQLLDPPPKP